MQQRFCSGRFSFLRPVLVIGMFALLAVAAPALYAQDAPGEFDIIRTALVEKFHVRMVQVADWSWEQVDFTDGIESCLDEAERTGASAPWGRRYLVTAFNGVTYEGRISYDQGIVVACDSEAHEQKMAAAAQPPAPAEQPAEAAADDAPQAAAPLPPPVAGGAALAGFSLGGHVNDMDGDTFDAMRRAGMTWLKKQYVFNVGDSPGNVAGMIETAHANGYRILIGIVGKQDQMWDYASYINTYAEFVAGVAALGADAIEVWNEPNIDHEWPVDSISGATYTQLLAAAYNAIKSANPGTVVISGAPAPTGYFGAAGCGVGGCNDDVFMRQMANAGAARYMDCVGLHYNEGIIAPSRTNGDPRGNYPTYYFRSMLQRGASPFGNKPVCFTELGYLSGEGYSTPIPGHFGWAGETTVAQHAAWLAEAATLAAQSGRVRLMIIWNVDFRDITPTDPLGGYAMIRPDNGCPACDTLGVVMRR